MRVVRPSEVGEGVARLSRAALTFRHAADGRTYLAEQFASYPFHLTRPFRLDERAAPGLTTLYLQSSSGGLYGGDDLHLSVRAGAGASAEVTSQASTVVHDARGGRTRVAVDLLAEPDSFLAYWPDPTILLPGAALRQSLTVTLAEDATVLIADAFLPHDPRGEGMPFARLESDVLVRREDGRVLVADRLHVGGRQWSAALGGRHAAAANALVLGPGAGTTPADIETALALPGVEGGAGQLPNGAGIGVRLLARDGVALSAALRRLWEAAFAARFGHAPAKRRK